MQYFRNERLKAPMLPVNIVFHPSWWNRHAGITFDEDFFFHPAHRVEAERKMERVLHDRWGRYGLGENHQRDLPQVGPVHLAAGYIIGVMLGCPISLRGRRAATHARQFGAAGRVARRPSPVPRSAVSRHWWIR